MVRPNLDGGNDLEPSGAFTNISLCYKIRLNSDHTFHPFDEQMDIFVFFVVLQHFDVEITYVSIAELLFFEYSLKVTLFEYHQHDHDAIGPYIDKLSGLCPRISRISQV